MLALGHWASDFYPGMLSPLLPLISERHGWSLARLGVLVMAMQVAANAGQPIFGVLNDRRPLPWFLWAGPLVSALPFVFLLMIPNLPLMVAILVVSGLGVAMFHPVGAVAAGHIADENRRGISMALFSSGGSVGVATAPLAAVLIVEVLGEGCMWLAIIPALITATYFLRDRGYHVSERHGLTMRQLVASLEGNRRELALLWFVSSCRAVVYILIMSFLPMLYIARGATYAGSAYTLSAALLAGMMGLLIGGHLSDRFGGRRIMRLSLFIATPLLYGFLYTDGILSLVLLLGSTLTLSSTIPVNIVLAQIAAPRLKGVASSLVMGMSFMVGALVAPPFGALADRIGIAAAMNLLFAVPVLGGLATFLLRRE